MTKNSGNSNQRNPGEYENTNNSRFNTLSGPTDGITTSALFQKWGTNNPPSTGPIQTRRQRKDRAAPVEPGRTPPWRPAGPLTRTASGEGSGKTPTPTPKSSAPKSLDRLVGSSDRLEGSPQGQEDLDRTGKPVGDRSKDDVDRPKSGGDPSELIVDRPNEGGDPIVNTPDRNNKNENLSEYGTPAGDGEQPNDEERVDEDEVNDDEEEVDEDEEEVENDEQPDVEEQTENGDGQPNDGEPTGNDEDQNGQIDETPANEQGGEGNPVEPEETNPAEPEQPQNVDQQEPGPILQGVKIPFDDNSITVPTPETPKNENTSGVDDQGWRTPSPRRTVRNSNRNSGSERSTLINGSTPTNNRRYFGT